MSCQGFLKECWIGSLLNQLVLFAGQFAKSKDVCFLFPAQASVKVRIKGEKAPELLLELQDDDRTQTFLTQVKSAQPVGKTRLFQSSKAVG